MVLIALQKLCFHNTIWLLSYCHLYKFLHPNHVKPLAKLIAAAVKVPHLLISHVLMKLRTEVVQVAILIIYPRDAGVKVYLPHSFQLLLYFRIESLAYAFAVRVLANVDRHLHAVVVSRAGAQGASIAIPQNLAFVSSGYKIWKLLQRVGNALAKLLHRRRNKFKGDASLNNIRCVDSKKSLGIIRRCSANINHSVLCLMGAKIQFST